MCSISGIDINHYHLENIRRNISYVSSNEFLFTDSLYNNLTLEKDVSDDLFEEVSKITRVNEIVSKREENYKMIVEVLWECARKYYNRAASSRTDDKNQCFEMWNEIQGVNHNYWYENEWAIQLYEDPKTLVKAIDVFGSRNVMDKKVASLQNHILTQETVYPYQCLSWNGRVFFRFPTPTREYAECLVSLLKKWRETLRECANIHLCVAD
jgi:hypothetical protein